MPVAKPPKLADQPAWHGPGGIMDIEDDGDAILFTHGDGLLTLIDARTGANRWSLEKLHDLGDARGVLQTFQAGPGERHLVDDGVLVTYPENPPRSRGMCDSGPDDETGVALLSPADGHVVWRTPVIASFPDVPDGTWPMYIVGDTLLGMRSGEQPGVGPDRRR